jgi:NAD(P)-dependent dehydrogenase (short-subunit alcohol dehydrogenase family)
MAMHADCIVVADIRRLFRETISRFGGVDIVVNNAGPEGVVRCRSRKRPRSSLTATCQALPAAPFS